MNRIVQDSRARLSLEAPEAPRIREADIDMTGIFRLIRRRIWFISAVTLVLTILALPFVLASAPKYQARAQFILQQVMVADPRADEPVLDINNEVERLRSRAIADQVIARFNLQDHPGFNPAADEKGPIRAIIDSLPFVADDAPPEEPDSEETAARVLASFNGRLSVWRRVESQMVEVLFTAPDPKLAAAVPNSIVEIYRTDREAGHKQRIADVLASLNQQIEAQREVVERRVATLERFQGQSGVVSVGRGAELLSANVSRLSEQISEIRAAQLELSGRAAAAEMALSAGGTAVTDESEALTEMRQLLQARKRELTRMQASYGEAFGGVRVEQARIEELETAIRDELTTWIETMTIQLQQLSDREATLLKTLSDSEDALARTSMAELTLVDLLRRADEQRAVLDSLEDRHRLLAARLLQPPVDVEILAPATEPIWQEGRSRKVTLAIAAVAALIVALTLAGILEVMDPTVRSLEQLSDVPGLTPVGSLPRPKLRARLHNRPQADPGLMDALRGSVVSIKAANDGLIPDSLAIIATENADSMDRFAGLLAADISAEGHGVLLIDTRPARNRGKTATVRPDSGLVRYLRGPQRSEPATTALLDSLVIQTSHEGVLLLPRGAGRLPTLHDDSRIAPLIDYAAARGLTPIFLCPPVLSNASVIQIAAAVESVLLVVTWGSTRGALVRLAVERLRTARNVAVLAVLTNVNPGRQKLYSFRDSATFSAKVPGENW
ncbi:Uncharacterized protein involved in exopolysaccharide biosynthesis [Jannaschia faecimaris]|uniref:Uncharacterized protein involved in exopolysaccharide biosynthesis n=1 Tax=Jannaschia faecimaris TaxID=1244108 RepID=A0A1H3JAS6_9RHOB|nr:exopolysaccharide transport family protein [Jannaschia faecimaris]SDY37032.1 Uncharacterized protein involved in exopolysaccharide biosynthesis [Jannaschia faecimaris]